MSMTASEGDRRNGNMLQLGEVIEVDPGAAKVRVKIGDLETDWIPWMSKAGADHAWWPLEAGEWVVVGAPSGDMAQAIVLGSVPTGGFPAHGAAGTFRLSFGSGAYIEHTGGNLNIVAPGTITLNGARIDLN